MTFAKWNLLTTSQKEANSPIATPHEPVIVNSDADVQIVGNQELPAASEMSLVVVEPDPADKGTFETINVLIFNF